MKLAYTFIQICFFSFKSKNMNNLGIWNPINPEEAYNLFRRLQIPWWIAGGWAIDLFLCRQTRPHDDIDILILRRDQLAMQEYLSGCDLQAADPPGVLRPWKEKEFLPKGIHDIWCRKTPQEPWVFQIMLAEDDGTKWIFRRDSRIAGLIMELGKLSDDGIPYLAPEIQLLYKSKEPREKDEADFAQVLPFMDENARKWLINALMSLYPDGHPWIKRLSLSNDINRK